MRRTEWLQQTRLMRWEEAYESHRYMGSPNRHIVNADFTNLTDEQRRDYTIRKEM